MPRSAASLLTLALLVTAALALASCGGSDAQLLPGRTASEITANLDAVKQLAAEGDCAGAESAALQVSEQVDALGGVDPKLKRALLRGAVRLNEVVARCEATAEPLAPANVQPEEETSEGPPKKEKKSEKQQEEEAPAATEAPGTEPSQPPAKGEGQGPGSGEAGAEEEAVPPQSGGVSPNSPVEGER